jgi:Na+/H+ antiporter NhaC
MTGCAMAAFIPPAYFAGISTTGHMVGSNLATLLAR